MHALVRAWTIAGYEDGGGGGRAVVVAVPVLIGVNSGRWIDGAGLLVERVAKLGARSEVHSGKEGVGGTYIGSACVCCR
jgi:hypothetical protein